MRALVRLVASLGLACGACVEPAGDQLTIVGDSMRHDSENGVSARLQHAWTALGSDPALALTNPTRSSASGTWITPSGEPITLVTNVGYTRPAEQDGVGFTAYYSEQDGQFWVHEGGGISGYTVWYGPFSLD